MAQPGHCSQQSNLPNRASDSQRSLQRTGSASASVFLRQTAVMRGYSALQGTQASVPYSVQFPGHSYSQAAFDSRTSIYPATGAVVIGPLWRWVWHLPKQPALVGRRAEKTPQGCSAAAWVLSHCSLAGGWCCACGSERVPEHTRMRPPFHKHIRALYSPVS